MAIFLRLGLERGEAEDMAQEVMAVPLAQGESIRPRKNPRCPPGSTALPATVASTQRGAKRTRVLDPQEPMLLSLRARAGR